MISWFQTCLGLCIVSWWRHQMETFSALLAICAGNSPVPGEIPTQRPVTRSLMFSLICARKNDWVNNGEAGDLRRHLAHYDVIVMLKTQVWYNLVEIAKWGWLLTKQGAISSLVVIIYYPQWPFLDFLYLWIIMFTEVSDYWKCVKLLKTKLWKISFLHFRFIFFDILGSVFSCLTTLVQYQLVMITSPNGNIFRVTGPLCGEFTGDRWIPPTKESDAELWCFLWSALE